MYLTVKCKYVSDDLYVSSASVCEGKKKGDPAMPGRNIGIFAHVDTGKTTLSEQLLAQFASVTGGKGSMSTSLHGYRECAMELGRTAPRRGADPLDTARYILAARNALESDIY